MPTALKRTAEEAILRMREIEEAQTDPGGIERSRLLESLPWDAVQPFLCKNHTYTEETWNEVRTTHEERLISDAREFLETFAWPSANNSKGGGARKAVQWLRGQVWLFGHKEGAQDLMAFLDRMIDPKDPLWIYFGKPYLVRVSEFIGFDWRNPTTGDNGKWIMERGDEPMTANAAMGV